MRQRVLIMPLRIKGRVDPFISFALTHTGQLIRQGLARHQFFDGLQDPNFEFPSFGWVANQSDGPIL